MKRVLKYAAETVAFAGAVVIVLLAIFAVAVMIGVCVGLAHLGYEWTVGR